MGFIKALIERFCCMKDRQNLLSLLTSFAFIISVSHLRADARWIFAADVEGCPKRHLWLCARRSAFDD